MTIDEAIEKFKYDAECNRADLDISYAEENEQVAELLEELKAYRAIGTVEELTALEKSDASKEKSSIEYYNQMREYRDKLAEYESIGTVEECRAAVERQKHIDTPTCNEDSARAVQWLKNIAENRRVSLYCAEECANILLNMLATAE